jgi:phosphoribosylformimino-5-aminoimidazole carboxamide ribotide isomerase
VIGTAAHRNPEIIDAVLAVHAPERIVAAVDARAGMVAVEGWERETTTSVEVLIRDLAGRGVQRFLYTPVEVDGTLSGPNVEGLRSAAAVAEEVGTELIYSGGVGSLEHLRGLAALELPALGGVVVGTALYEERFTVSEAQAALEPAGPR